MDLESEEGPEPVLPGQVSSAGDSLVGVEHKRTVLRFSSSRDTQTPT